MCLGTTAAVFAYAAHGGLQYVYVMKSVSRALVVVPWAWPLQGLEPARVAQGPAVLMAAVGYVLKTVAMEGVSSR